MKKHKWINNNLYVEIEAAWSVDCKADVYIIDSNALDGKISVAWWREQIPLTDEDKVNKLFSSVEHWTEKNNFKKET